MSMLSPSLAFRRSITSWSSLFRRTPLSTKIGKRLSPMALWMRTDITDESTPPESAQTTLESPTCFRMAATVSSTNDAGDQLLGMPQISWT